MHSRDVMLLRKNISRNYYYCDQDENSLGLCFKSMYLTLIVAIFTSNFIFSMFKSFHTYRNINISNLLLSCGVEYGKNENEKSLLIKIVLAFYPLLSGEEISSHFVAWNMPKM